MAFIFLDWRGTLNTTLNPEYVIQRLQKRKHYVCLYSSYLPYGNDIEGTKAKLASEAANIVLTKTGLAQEALEEVIEVFKEDPRQTEVWIVDDDYQNYLQEKLEVKGFKVKQFTLQSVKNTFPWNQ